MVLDIDIFILSVEVRDNSVSQAKTRVDEAMGHIKMPYLIAEW